MGLGAFFLPFFLLRWLFSGGAAAWPLGVAMMLCGLNLLVLRLEHRPGLARHINVSALYFLIVLGGLWPGHGGSLWVALLAPVAILQLSRLGGWLWVGGTALTILALGSLSQPSDPELLSRLAALIGSALCASVLSTFRPRANASSKLWSRKPSATPANHVFLTHVSHEIRTPVNSVIGSADLLMRSDLNPQQQSQVEVISASAHELLAVMDDVLDLSRLEAGRLALQKVDFRLRELLEETVALLRPRCADRHLELSMTLAPDLPDHLRGDTARLTQILLILVGNAIKFTEEGDVEVEVAPDLRLGERMQLRFTVRDTGVGIAPDDLIRLFSPDAEADRPPQATAGHRFGGAGLGLTLARKLVEMMGGEIGCESTPGVGSTFWFRVPLEHALGEGMAGRMPGTAPESWQLEKRRDQRVLVVDDNAANRLVTREELLYLGYQADEAANGREALAKLERRSFDAVLMDCQMPDLDGYEITRRLRQRETGDTHVVVIAMTAHALMGERRRCLDSGMDDYLAKPFHVWELAETLDRWLFPSMFQDDPKAGLSGGEAPRVAVLPQILLDPEAPEPPSRTSVLDAERLEMLRSLGEQSGHDVLNQLLTNFRREGPELVRQLQVRLAAADPRGIVRVAHSLAGSAGTVGAMEVCRLARELEQGAPEEAAMTLVRRIEAITEALEHYLTALETTYGPEDLPAAL